MKKRIIVSVIGLPVLFYLVLFAPFPLMMAALAVLTGVGAFELMRCVGGRDHPILIALTILASVLMLFGVRSQYYAFWLFIYMVAAFFYAILSGGSVPAHLVLSGGAAVSFIPYAFSAFLTLHANYHRGFLLLPFIFSFLSDTGGYFAGRFFGKHKLSPKISPKKTIEGSVGGFLGSAVGGLVFAAVMNTWQGETLNYIGILLLGLICSLLGQMGDLSFSLIKREYGIKDYSRLFSEHGGVLDRFDSVIFVAPAVMVLLPLLT